MFLFYACNNSLSKWILKNAKKFGKPFVQRSVDFRICGK